MEPTTETQSNKKIVWAIVLIVVLLFGYVIYSVIESNTNKANETMDATTTPTELESTAAPRIAQKGDIIVINYTGKLENGTEFDSSYKRGQPFVFQVGEGQVIQGWDEGLIGVKKGDAKTLTIPANKGYGNQDIKDAAGKVIIPKNSTLIFDVEVVEVISKEDAERMMAEQQAAQSTSTAGIQQ